MKLGRGGEAVEEESVVSSTCAVGGRAIARGGDAAEAKVRKQGAGAGI